MKKLILNEDLFEPFEFSELFPDEDAIEKPSDFEIPSAAVDAEIDMVEEATPSGPSTGAETGIANQIIEMINGEWNTIADYNNLIAMLTQYGFEEFIPVIEDINNEENLHVGQLQALLQKISPNAGSIQQGELEASSEQLSESYKHTDLGYVKGTKYTCTVYDDGKVYIKSVHPYDEADYHWAVSYDEGNTFRIYIGNPGKPVEMIDDDTDNYSTVVNRLSELDKNISSRMSHN